MYTSYIGKKFLEYYIEEYGKSLDYSAEQFFDEVMFPLFFDDERHLMHVSNSPFFYKAPANELIKHGSETAYQNWKFKNTIESGDYGGNILVGYGSSDFTATTSGQLSDLNIEKSSEEAYLSWIGQALAVSVKGGIANLIDKKEILLLLFEGWSQYSEFIKQTPGLKDKQIETWNGNYLVQMLNNQNQDFNFGKLNVEVKLGIMAIQTVQWTELLFELAKYYKNEILHSYVYNLSQMNTTIGITSFFLKEIHKMYQLRDLLFIDEKTTVLSDNQIEKMMPFYTFKKACMHGIIGLKSIEPNGLRNYIPKGTYDFAKGNDFNIEKENNFFIYKLWIMAMLNKKELLDLSREFAAVILEAVKGIKNSNRARTTDKQFIKELFECKSSKQFIDITNNLIDDNNSDMLRKLVEEVVLMPRDNFPLFVTLIKFEYSILSNKE